MALDLVRSIENVLVHGFDLRPLPLAAELGARTGSWKNARVDLVARAYSGRAIRFCRFVELSGGDLAIGNALCLPRTDLLLPIFGADVVCAGHGAAMIAADLSPVCDMVGPEMPRDALPSGGELPDWCRRVFSHQSLYARLPLSRIDDAREPLLARARALVAMPAVTDPSRVSEIAAAQRVYCTAHLDDDKGLGMLARMFGHDWAQDFLHKVMFPP